MLSGPSDVEVEQLGLVGQRDHAGVVDAVSAALEVLFLQGATMCLCARSSRRSSCWEY
jgi:hypothetical protein